MFALGIVFGTQIALNMYHYYWYKHLNPVYLFVPILYAAFGYWVGACYDKVKSESIKDGLTGLYNRRFVQELYPKLASQAKRKNSTLSVALIDMDNLKNINDQQGHKQGDQAIMALCNICLSRLRGSDILARWGGDEFVIIAPFTGVEQMEMLVQRIREASLSAGVEFSYGIASFPGNARGLDELVKVADARMYEHKFARRADLIRQT